MATGDAGSGYVASFESAMRAALEAGEEADLLVAALGDVFEAAFQFLGVADHSEFDFFADPLQTNGVA